MTYRAAVTNAHVMQVSHIMWGENDLLCSFHCWCQYQRKAKECHLKWLRNVLNSVLVKNFSVAMDKEKIKKKKTWNEVVRSIMLGCRATELGREERLVEINHKTSLDRLDQGLVMMRTIMIIVIPFKGRNELLCYIVQYDG